MNCNLVQNIRDFIKLSPDILKKGVFVTATDTNIGKSYISAHMLKALEGVYFKPIQAGDLEIGGDTALVKRISGMSEDHFLQPIYNLELPLSPHEAAQKQNITIDLNKITFSIQDKPLIIEGAGGIMVPINDQFFMMDVIKKSALPVVLVVRSQLGTLNHSLMTLQILKSHDIPIAAIIMNGPIMENNLKSLKQFSGIDAIFTSEWIN